MNGIPRTRGVDQTLALLREGNNFLPARSDRLGTDVFRARLMGREALCVRGEDAARMFYRPDRFTRQGAMPPTSLKLLQDRGSVQTLDGDAHHHRKQLFLDLLSAAEVRRLSVLVEAHWDEALYQWQQRDSIRLHDEVQLVLCRAACAWAGIPLDDVEARRRTRDFAAMIGRAGRVGPGNWLAQLRRRQTEKWARGWIRAARQGRLLGSRSQVLAAVAGFRDGNGDLLDEEVATVELLNLLRPTVAVARYVVFVALALHRFPEVRDRLHASPDDDEYRRMFVQEVRRFFPFFPMIGGRVREPFRWRNHRFRPGEWVLLDIYGTNHDPRLWPVPHRFRPERFAGLGADSHSLIPQGGGDDYLHHHRCPGEPLTIELMKTATRLLLFAMDYQVPHQDLRVDLARVPSLPRSGFIMSSVRRPQPGGGHG